MTPQAGTTDNHKNHKNHAKKTGEWNVLTIEFRPPTLKQVQDPDDPTKTISVVDKAAWIKTVLNGKTVFEGELIDSGGVKLKGTGSRPTAAKYKPLDTGAIYLQSHWGSQVEFRNVQIISIA